MCNEVFLQLLSSLFFGAIFAPGPRDPNSTKDPAILSGRQPGDQSKQRQVDSYFDVRAQDWKAIYVNDNLRSRIYQERQALTLNWIDQLDLPVGGRVLETGCGAGLLTVALAQRGFMVDALDTVPTMLDLTRAAASDLGVESRVRAVAGDVHHLEYPDDSFHAVLGLGVLPWLHSPQLALTEMARVLKPGGYLLVTVDNLWRLNDVLDARRTPVFGFFRRIFSLGRHHWRAFRNRRLGPTLARLDSTHDLDSGINAAGLTRIKSVTLGFGPFSIWDRPMFNEATGIALHRKLQSLADRNFPILRSTGAHYVVLAQKWTDSGNH